MNSIIVRALFAEVDLIYYQVEEPPIKLAPWTLSNFVVDLGCHRKIAGIFES